MNLMIRPMQAANKWMQGSRLLYDYQGRKVEIEDVGCIVPMRTASNKVDAAEEAVGSNSWLQHPRGLGENEGMSSQ
jgi:hypothetical protein